MLTMAFAPAAFLAGLLMFLAPCTLPIVPGYLAFIAGSNASAVKKHKVMANAFAFVIGFSVVFILLGTFAAFLGALAGPWRFLLSRVGGFMLVVFGLTMLGVVRIPFLSAEKHIALPKFLTIGRAESSFVIGTLFALGWSPCVGPVLGSILTSLLLAPISGSVATTMAQGAFLLSIFSLGLALPFLLTALLIDHAGALFARWGKASVVLSYIGGVVLILVGILMLTNNIALLTEWGYNLFGFLGYDRLLNYL